jgi:hypothetical protein
VVILLSAIISPSAQGSGVVDCNGNGIADSIDIAQGTSQDCNTNQVPDECEDGSTAHSTGNMGAFYWQNPAQGQLTGCMSATTTVRIRIEARGDLGAPTEFLTLRLNNTNIANVFVQDGFDCDQLSTTTVNISAAQWNSLITSGGSTIQVRLVASLLVDPDCTVPPRNPLPGQSFVSVAYGNGSYDCNGNGTSDLCEIAGGAADCNGNGRLDLCEIAAGETPDCDSNSVPDSCQVDSDGDGVINPCDGCPNDPAKTAPGACGCGVPDTDSDGDGVAD